MAQVKEVKSRGDKSPVAKVRSGGKEANAQKTTDQKGPEANAQKPLDQKCSEASGPTSDRAMRAGKILDMPAQAAVTPSLGEISFAVPKSASKSISMRAGKWSSSDAFISPTFNGNEEDDYYHGYVISAAELSRT
ncbi:unnamed protein product [Gongylonema pulchrum]|uniref:Uncharacterized protein n=1 Tax=Gongylonema pulchrum TaxID=637853 RepID=A0A183DIA9_9BILA|nr:unnamed protein product [Gongylonema pulchrum]